MANVNEWSPLEDGNINLDQYSLERQISPESELNRYTKKIMAAVRAKADAMQAEIDALDPSGLVHVDGDETLGGVKTFVEPIVGDVSVTASGSSTARLLSDRLAEAVNVKDFGAAGDGETDDSEAIQAAVTAGAGKTVFFPVGEYVVGGEISSTSSVSLLLDKNAVLKKTTAACMLYFAADNCSIDGGVFVSSEFWDRDVSDIYGLIEVVGKNFRISNSRFINVNKANIYLKPNGPVSQHPATNNSLFVSNCVFEGNYPYVSQGVTDGENGTNNQIYAIWTYAGSGFSGLQVENCKFDSYIEAVYLGGYAADLHASVVVFGNSFTNIVDHCAYLNADTPNLVAGNHCSHCNTPFAIRGHDCIVSDNVVDLNCEFLEEDWKRLVGFSFRSVERLVVANNTVNGYGRDKMSVIQFTNLSNSPQTTLHDILILGNIINVSGGVNISFASDLTTDIYNIKIKNNIFKITGRSNSSVITGPSSLVVRNAEISDNYFYQTESGHDFIAMSMDSFLFNNNHFNLNIGNDSTGTIKVLYGPVSLSQGSACHNIVTFNSGYTGSTGIEFLSSPSMSKLFVHKNAVYNVVSSSKFLSSKNASVNESGNTINGDIPFNQNISYSGTNCSVYDCGDVLLIKVDSTTSVSSPSTTTAIATLPQEFTPKESVFVALGYTSSTNTNNPATGTAFLNTDGKIYCKAKDGNIERVLGSIILPRACFTCTPSS